MLDRAKIVKTLKGRIEYAKNNGSFAAGRNKMIMTIQEGEELLAFLTEPVGAYYEYGESLCKQCRYQVIDDDTYCPCCGRLLWGKEE